MSKQVMITEELFYDLVRWHLIDLRDPDLQVRIQSGLQDKLDRMSSHDEYCRNMSKHKNNL